MSNSKQRIECGIVPPFCTQVMICHRDPPKAKLVCYDRDGRSLLACRREGRCNTRFLVCCCSLSLKNEYDPCRNAGNTHPFSPTCNSCQDGCNPGHNLKRQNFPRSRGGMVKKRV